MIATRRQKILIKSRPNAAHLVITSFLCPLVILALLQLLANLLYIINDDDYGTSAGQLHLSPTNGGGSLLLGVEDGCPVADGGCIFGQHQQAASIIKRSHQKFSTCSSTSKISSPDSSLPRNKQQTWWNSLSSFFNTLTTLHLKHPQRSIWGGHVLLAQGISLYQANQDKAIIILNSTNLYPELLQSRHPFPHIKLIEYYVSHCGVCARFKSTYTKLAKAIHPWRNVMRPSAIDLGVSNNSPVAQAWTIRVIPALTINPPPEIGLACKLDRQMSNWSTIMHPMELHKSMFALYNSSQWPLVQTLNVSRYMDKTDLLKADLVVQIENYARNNNPPANLPPTWPNLRPVTETTLPDLLRTHPRKELFLLIEGSSLSLEEDHSSSASSSSSSSSGTRTTRQPSLGVSVILELSTSAAWKSIRYMRANENKALLKDVIMEQKRLCELLSGAASSSCSEQVELLNNLLSNKQQQQPPTPNNSMLLIHIDGSHGASSSSRAGGLAAFPLMKLITTAELASMAQAGQLGQQQQETSFNADRAKRAINHPAARRTRSLFDSGTPSSGSSSAVAVAAAGADKMTSERTVELLTQYINLTYADTEEDRHFLYAINNVINSQDNSVRQAQEDTIGGSGGGQSWTEQAGASELTTTPNSLMTHIYDMLNIRDKRQQTSTTTTNTATASTANYSFPPDYEDKLKAMRYLLFSEVPRSSLHADKNSQDQQDRLNTLINLLSVIKSYFPLPDASSIQFIAGVHAYLIKEANNQGRISGGGSFDVSGYKQELKRLEAENKRLPEVKEFKLCVNSGYPCALWRLFHTLAAFEHKKLSEIRRQASSSNTPPPPHHHHHHQHPDTSFPPSAPSSSEVITGMKSQPPPMVPPTSSLHDARLPSPVERLVSPPSTAAVASTSLSLTTSSFSSPETSANNGLPMNESDLPTPVLLVMRDYITTFFSCEECRPNFRSEAAELSLERIRQQEPAEFSVLWLWNVHNRISKRLAMEPANIAAEPSSSSPAKVWFPTYEQCTSCYRRPPSFQQMLPAVDQITMFQESIDWNSPEVLSFLAREYLKDPLDKGSCGLLESQLLYIGLLAAISCSCLLLMLVHRCIAIYLERQRRHKANILNGNGVHTYSLALNE